MLFNSYEFLFFSPFVALLFYLLPHKFRWLFLLFASCFFYMFFKPEYILILAFTIVVDYYAGIYIERAEGRKRFFFLILSLVANIGVLAVFKYYNIINNDITGICTLLGYHNSLPYLNILLPIGLSFHTYQAMSYTIEVYRRKQTAEKHAGIYALYVMFYPQLVAGPIERPQNMLHQFHEKKVFIYDNVVSGLRLMLLGFFKKIMLADRLAVFTDAVYTNPAEKSPHFVVAALFLYAFQIYYDFSAYSDIAIGCARVMGFNLMNNFNYPFVSKNVTEFWRRWHISLSTWFRDYVFFPLVKATKSAGKYSIIFALLVTFFLSGIWHSASWNFIIFGLLEAFILIYEYLTRPQRLALSHKIPAWIYGTASQIITFCVLAFSWIFFRAKDLPEACVVINKIPAFFNEVTWSLFDGSAKTQMPDIVTVLNPNGSIKATYAMQDVLLLFALVFLSQSISYAERNFTISEKLLSQPTYVRWGFYYTIIFIIVAFGVFEGRQFIYFQF